MKDASKFGMSWKHLFPKVYYTIKIKRINFLNANKTGLFKTAKKTKAKDFSLFTKLN